MKTSKEKIEDGFKAAIAIDLFLKFRKRDANRSVVVVTGERHYITEQDFESLVAFAFHGDSWLNSIENLYAGRR